MKGLLVGIVLLAMSPSAFAQQSQRADGAHDGRTETSPTVRADGPTSLRAEVALGQDLVAWQTLEQRRMVGAPAIDAYKSFMLHYSGSPLAVMAFGRLNDLHAPFELWAEDPELKAAIAPIRRAWEATQRALASTSAHKPVAMMDMGDAIVEDSETQDTGR